LAIMSVSTVLSRLSCHWLGGVHDLVVMGPKRVENKGSMA
jgi:hypothetical protein